MVASRGVDGSSEITTDPIGTGSADRWIFPAAV